MQEILEKIQEEVQPYFGRGEVADYIPELAKVKPNQFAMTILTIDGKEFSVGQADTKFSIQSISKVIVLTMAMEILQEKLWVRVGREPSGTPFNSLIQLEREYGKPRNPFINAGALVTTDTIIENGEDAYVEILEFVRNLAQNQDIHYDSAVAGSEYKHSERNMALTYFMKSFGNIKSEPLRLIDVYSHHCSMALSTRELARTFLFLANGGINPLTGEQVISKMQTKRVNSLMLTCGLYDNVGDFAYRVGLPAKSGVGGGIVSVLPGQFIAVTWAPELNSSGNSLVGTRALELFTNMTELSIF